MKGVNDMRKLMWVLLIASLPLLQGCLPLLVAGTGIAIGQGRKGEAQKINARSEAYKQYQEVRMMYIKENAERAKQHLEPVPIPEYDEWLNIISDKKVRKVADIETKKEQITGKEEIQDLKNDIQKKDEANIKVETPKVNNEPKNNFSP